MTPPERLEQGALFDLSDRTKLRVTGADRVRFLNGQISNDVRKASGAVAIYACVLNAKGKINGDVFIHADADSLLVDADPSLHEALSARLERYVIADDVQIADVTEELALLHVIGDMRPAVPEDAQAVQADRFGSPGFDLWLSRAARESTLHDLATLLPFCDADCAEGLRIERGIPRWGYELSEEIIPTEANLESRAVDYAQGCYIGQEVISRMKMSGQTNKRLCGLVADQELHAGMRLLAEAGDGKDVGWISSAAKSARAGKHIALGFVKRGFNEVGRQLLASNAPTGEQRIRVSIVGLPFDWSAAHDKPLADSPTGL